MVSESLPSVLIPASKSNGVIIFKHFISPLLLVLHLQNVQTAHRKSWPSNVLSSKRFGLILKNKIATMIVNCLKIINTF